MATGFATHDFFERLGVALPLGRGFRPEDDRRGAAPVAILTDRFWRQSFEASPTAIGQAVTLSGKPVTVIGVAAPGFRGLDLAAAPDLYLPLHTIADLGSTSMNYFAEPSHGSSPTAGLKVVGRIRTGDPVAQVVARLSGLNTSPRVRTQPQIEVTPLNVAALGEAARTSMLRFSQLLAGTIALLLAIAGGTVTLLLLVRTEARHQGCACSLLLAGATLLIRSLQAALDLNPRVRMEQVVTGTLSLSQHGYDPVRAGVFFDRLRSRLDGHPGFASVAYSVEQGGMGTARPAHRQWRAAQLSFYRQIYRRRFAAFPHGWHPGG